MSDFYLMSSKQGPRIASAFAPESTRPSHELLADLRTVKELPFELSLVKLTVGKDGLSRNSDMAGVDPVWLDYQPNSLAWPIFSEKLKDCLEKLLSGKEGISWITVIIHGQRESRTYFVPRFSNELDVLDLEKTKYVPGTDHIIKPVFSLQKVQNYSIFHKPSSNFLWMITPGLYVSEKVKKAIQKEKITGVDFEKTAVG